jgi:hypothetical protein
MMHHPLRSAAQWRQTRALITKLKASIARRRPYHYYRAHLVSVSSPGTIPTLDMDSAFRETADVFHENL